MPRLFTILFGRLHIRVFALTSGESASDDGWLTSITGISRDRVRRIGDLLLAQVAWCVQYHGGFSELYASCSLWVVMVVGVVSGAPRDEISSFDKGLEAGRQTLGGQGQCRLHSS